MIIGLRIAAFTVLSMIAAGSLSAQATRTWVSGVGDDANPCSRTAPCKTFAGAISKTAAGGEIDALDPSGFGTLTITKAITIEGTGTNASILAGGTNGFVINAGINDVVVLRNLSIDGFQATAGSDTRGIKFLAGKELVVENCEVFNFAKRNISIESSTPNALALITNTTVHDGLNNGIAVTPPVGITNQVVIDHVRSVGNASFGVAVAAGGAVQIINSVLSNNATGGLWVDTATVDLASSMISMNPTGIEAQNSATVRMSNNSLLTNGTGMSYSGATISSFGNNQIAGNTSGNSPVSSTIANQ